MFAFIQRSLKLKIQMGYLILLLPLLASLVVSYLSLNSIWKRIHGLETIDYFTQNLLEIRRYEKNYFLYHKIQDLDRALTLSKNALNILENHRNTFLKIDEQLFKELEKSLLLYYSAISSLKQHELDLYSAGYIRNLGRSLIETSKKIRQKEVAFIDDVFQKMMSLVFILGLISVGTISGVGYFMSRTVVSPLEELEDTMRNIVLKKDNLLDTPKFPKSKDKEIVSVFKTFNFMIKELEARKEQLVQSKKLAALGTLLSGVAHELNNPLSNASSTCQILLEDLDEFDKETLRNFIKQIDNEIWRARDIVRTLLEFSRNRHYELKRWPLEDLVNEVIFMLRNKIRDNIKIHLYISDNLEIYVDKQRFQQVLINLLSNAIDAIEGEGEILIKACEDPDRRGVFIAIEDNGSGIPQDILEKIFDPFFTTKGAKGSGLGLYLVNEIVYRHGGTIDVESEQGKGTTFYLFFPYERESSNNQKTVKFHQNNEGKKCQLNQKKIN